MSSDLVGFQALGRHGELGVVVGVADGGDGHPQEIVIRGGVSSALIYFVPPAHVHAISPERRTVVLDVDLTDFVPTLRADGTIELRLSAA